eukprot:813240-Alexandrium_andersonii.AAC.1
MCIRDRHLEGGQQVRGRDQLAASSPPPLVTRQHKRATRQTSPSGCGVVWCGVVWCGVVWSGLVWCRVAWRGMAWRGVG